MKTKLNFRFTDNHNRKRSLFVIPWRMITVLIAIMSGVIVVNMNSRGKKDLFQSSLYTNTDRVIVQGQLQAALDSFRNRYGFPGATASYMWNDGKTGQASTGLSDVEEGIEMTTESRMLAASIGKTFVGALAVSLADEGIINMDEAISVWFHDCDWFTRLPNHEKITLRHLLTHRSGLQNHVYLKEFESEMSRVWPEQVEPFAPDSLIRFILEKPPLFDAGEAWAYTDTGYILTGMVIEKATGLDYYDMIRDRFLIPLKLNNTGPSNSRTLPGLASGYAANSALGFPRKTTTSPGEMAWHPGIEWTGGGLFSTSADLAKWAVSLFHGEALSDQARDLLLSSIPIDDTSPNIQYGMGVAVYTNGPFGTVYGHGGWIPGYSSSLRYYKDHEVAIAFQINTDIGIVDDTSSVIQEMENRLAEIVISSQK